MHAIEMGSAVTQGAVTVAQCPPEKLDEGIKIVSDSIVPELRQFKGFKGALLLVNRQAGKSMMIAVYDSEAEVKEVEHSGAYRTQVAKFAHLSRAPPTRQPSDVAYYALSTSR